MIIFIGFNRFTASIWDAERYCTYIKWSDTTGKKLRNGEFLRSVKISFLANDNEPHTAFHGNISENTQTRKT